MSNGSPPPSAADMKFLVEFRDYLNSAAYPASGSTIAFSTFVSDQAAGHRLADAKRTNPGYEPLARKLRNSIFMLSVGALVVTVFVAIMGAYVYWGNAIVASANSAMTARDSLTKDIAREEATGITRLYLGAYGVPVMNSAFPQPVAHISGVDPSMPGQVSTASAAFLGLCDAITQVNYAGNAVPVFLSSTQEYLCSQNTDIGSQIKEFQLEVGSWYGMSYRFLPFHSKELRRSPSLMLVAPHLLSVINGYAIPLMMGFLGSAAFVLRSFLERLGNRILTTRDRVSNRVRLVLGVLSGLAVGFFLSPSGSGSAPTDSLGLGISLTAPALAFLAGYAVDVLFRFLDTIAGRAFALK